MDAGGDAVSVSNPAGAYSAQCSATPLAAIGGLDGVSRRGGGGSDDRVDLSGIEGSSPGGVLVRRTTGGRGNPDGGVAGKSGPIDGLEVTRARIAEEWVQSDF